MAASKDTKDNAEPVPTTEPKASKSLAGTYKLLRGSFSGIAPKDIKREERPETGGRISTASYSKGDRIRYVAGDETRNTLELTDEQARRFLFNSKGAKIDPPRVEKV